MTSAAWRKLIATFLVVALGFAAVFSIRWIWRDITYWSRSVTVAYQTASLGDCVRTAIADWPEVSASSAEGVINLVVPGQEGALVKDTPDPHVARIVVYRAQRIGLAPRPGIGRAGGGASRRTERPDVQRAAMPGAPLTIRWLEKA